jgi:hypothetical protein
MQTMSNARRPMRSVVRASFAVLAALAVYALALVYLVSP